MENALALPDEAAIIARALAEPAAFAAVYDHYFHAVYNYVRYRVDNPFTADDLTARVFEKALAKLRSYRADRAPFGVWLFAIARNTITDHLRANRRRAVFSLDDLAVEPESHADPLPEQSALQHERQAELGAALARLGERDRDLLALKFAGGLTNRRIAELSGLSESNVGVIVYRAIRKLRGHLSEAETATRKA